MNDVTNLSTLIEKKIAIIGIGNCGGQIANLAEKKYSELFDSVYINTSDADLSMVSGAVKFKIGDSSEVEGSGKNRSKMKEYLRKDINKILQSSEFVDIVSEKKYVFIVASAAGGTGSGATPVFYDVMRRCFADVHFIPVIVLPQLEASLMEQGNMEEFLGELYGELANDEDLPAPTYMMYDNETTAHLSPTEGLEVVNSAIVEDLRILTGIDNFPTPYDSIDAADLESILTTPGRVVIARVKKDLTEKILEDVNIDDIIIKAIKQSCHTETDRNRKVVRWGIITHFTPDVNKLYNTNFDKLYEFIGTPIERFNHHSINTTRDEGLNFLYMICSGMSPINDRSKKARDRIEKLQAALADDKNSMYNLGDNASYSATEQRKKENIRGKAEDSVKPLDIFDKFMK